MGHLGQQSPRQVLFPDRRGPKAAGRTHRVLAPHVGGGGANTPNGLDPAGGDYVFRVATPSLAATKNALEAARTRSRPKGRSRVLSCHARRKKPPRRGRSRA